MIVSLNDLRGYKVQGTDGSVGKVNDFFFDDAAWMVRYGVLDTGGWLSGRLVLIAASALGQPDSAAKVFHVPLTKKQIEDSPPVEADQPVSRQYEVDLASYYGWPSYWTSEPMFGPAPVMIPPAGAERVQRQGELAAGRRADPHLQSLREVTGYHVLAADGEIGHIDDLLAESGSWAIRYLVADTRNWLPGKKALVAPQWVREVDWPEARVKVELSREKIRNSPEYSHGAPVTREYEAALYEYYGAAPYWKA